MPAARRKLAAAMRRGVREADERSPPVLAMKVGQRAQDWDAPRSPLRKAGGKVAEREERERSRGRRSR